MADPKCPRCDIQGDATEGLVFLYDNDEEYDYRCASCGGKYTTEELEDGV